MIRYINLIQKYLSRSLCGICVPEPNALEKTAKMAARKTMSGEIIGKGPLGLGPFSQIQVTLL
jgi:hypothetical protein